AFGALHNFELHLLPLGEGAETVRLDRRVMAEDVFTAAVLRDEAVALGVVEPLHSSSRHSRQVLRENGPAEMAGPGARCFPPIARGYVRGTGKAVKRLRRAFRRGGG